MLVNFDFQKMFENILKNQHMDPRVPGNGDVQKQKKLTWLRAVSVSAENDSAQFSLLDFLKFIS